MIAFLTKVLNRINRNIMEFKADMQNLLQSDRKELIET